ncbi:MAG TPA: Mrp/NBP35 family ATP-binding protein [Acidimicrobiales bacterium]|nr:Mrp/NBP35 family ATP-binding protein [Acidimicrobiales bacterium]
MAPDRSGLEQLAAQVIDPELDLPLGELGMVRGVDARRRRATVELAVPLADWPGLEELVARVRAVLAVAPGAEEIAVEVSVMTDDERLALRHRLRAEMGGQPAAPASEAADGHGHSHAEAPVPRFLQAGSSTRVVGISSGKGGVGKSSVTVNLALALARSGHRVAILDADVYGFSIPRMLGCEEDPVIIGDTVVPTRAHGVRCLSMGFFVPEDQPVIWRGPMLHKAIEQFLGDAYWGEPDFLLVDMPPGTGDVTLSLAQVMPRAEIVVVTTPQAAAHTVAQRSAFAARKLKLSVRGVIENMSWFTGDDGQRYELFGRGGGETLAGELGVPLLGRVPLVPALREGGDSGQPIVVTDVDGEAARAFIALAERLVALGPARVYRQELTLR